MHVDWFEGGHKVRFCFFCLLTILHFSFRIFSRAKEMVMNIVSTLSRNDGFNSSGGSNSGNDSDSHPPFQPNQNSGPPGQTFVSIVHLQDKLLLI